MIPPDVAAAVSWLLEHGLDELALLDLAASVRRRISEKRPGPVVLQVSVGRRAISSASVGLDAARVYHSLGRDLT